MKSIISMTICICSLFSVNSMAIASAAELRCTVDNVHEKGEEGPKESVRSYQVTMNCPDLATKAGSSRSIGDVSASLVYNRLSTSLVKVLLSSTDFHTFKFDAPLQEFGNVFSGQITAIDGQVVGAVDDSAIIPALEPREREIQTGQKLIFGISPLTKLMAELNLSIESSGYAFSSDDRTEMITLTALDAPRSDLLQFYPLYRNNHRVILKGDLAKAIFEKLESLAQSKFRNRTGGSYGNVTDIYEIGFQAPLNFEYCMRETARTDGKIEYQCFLPVARLRLQK